MVKDLKEITPPNKVAHSPEVRHDFYNSKIYKDRLQELAKHSSKDFLFPRLAM